VLVATSFPLGETKPLQSNLFGAMGSNATFVVVKLVLVLPVVALDDRDLVIGQSGKPAHDLVV
jgi:hypothetical protein